MIYRLIFLNGPRTGERLTVTEQPMCVGTDPGCAIHIDDSEIARRHAELFQKGDELFIRDLGSMNKILVNKREVQEARLKHGDEFELGRTRLVVQALVQAEVEGQRHARRRRSQTTWAVVSFLFIILVLALSARYVPRTAGDATRTDTSPVGTIGADTTPRTTLAITPALTEDLRTLREDVRAIQSSVKQLGIAPQHAAPTSLPTLNPPPSPRTPREEAQELLAAAHEARAGKYFAEADRLLAHIQNLDPDFLPAYEERARLFEEINRPGDAAMQWSEILRRSTESPLYQRAVTERIRLSQFGAMQYGTPDLRIASVQQTRFPATADYDEMRVLKIVLRANTAFRMDPTALRLDAAFFDRDTATGAIEPSQGRLITRQSGDLAPEWGASDERILTATCVIPKGVRAEQAAAGEPRSFYGYTVKLFYRDAQVDEAAQPRRLLAKERPNAELEAVATAPAAFSQ